jgi:hypothetical protein
MKANKCTSSKLLILAAIVAMVFTSCSNEDVINTTEATGEELALGFSTYVGNSTLRASVMDKDALQAKGFHVLAWKTDGASWSGSASAPDFMNDVEVTWNGSAWTYNPIKYWPGKYDGTNYGKVSFFGYAPATTGVAAAAGTATTNPTITFTTQDVAANQVDLVADMLLDEYYTSSSKTVKFQFEHLLSKIGFSAKLDAEYADTEVKVTGLTIKYVDDAIKKDGIYTFATDNTVATIWGAPGTQTYMSDDDEILTSGSVVLDNSASLALNANDKFLMLIPQTPEADYMIAELSYTIKTGNDWVSYTIQASLPEVTGGWLPGKQYTYTFSLTLNPVIFDTAITVSEWADGTQPGDMEIK